jgi:hypothetical protein
MQLLEVTAKESSVAGQQSISLNLSMSPDHEVCRLYVGDSDAELVMSMEK